MKTERIVESIRNSTIVKFLGVGVINTIVGTCVMFCFYNVFHLSYWISSASNYIVGGTISYFLNKNFTFKYDGGGWKVVLRFAINICICYFVAYGVAKPLVIHVLSGFPLSIQENIAMVVGMCLYVVLNYTTQRFVTFASKKD